MKKIELLSPAGDFIKLKIALSYGADAVYGGVSHFSLRNRASKEFSYEEFEEAVKYAHSLGKKIYVTVNGFPFNSQIKLVEKHLEKMASFEPDAFIVSTPGVIKLAKSIAPNIPLHLSTQANVLNYLDAEAYYEMGVKRIIAAREASLADLVEIKKHLPNLEIEIFIHGSMCFAYSGRCLISSLQMGRVPNRGSCANDCRFDYEIYVKSPENETLLRVEEIEGEGTYIFNAKDLNLSSHIKELLDSNVIDSFKIEGRTKSEYYAAIATRAYRWAIDDYYKGTLDLQKYEFELNTLKNRGYFDGYIVSRPFERLDTQNLTTAISEGSYQVVGMVLEDKKHFLCKDVAKDGIVAEIVLPMDTKIEPVQNEIGDIFEKDGTFYIRFKKIITQSGKELKEVHSGNINPILLPIELPPFTLFRRRI